MRVHLAFDLRAYHRAMETFSPLDLFWCLVLTGAAAAEIKHRVRLKRAAPSLGASRVVRRRTDAPAATPTAAL